MRILVMETGSLDTEYIKPKTLTMKTIHSIDSLKKLTGKKVHGAIGGAVKASYQIYDYFKKHGYDTDFLADFSTVDKKVKGLTTSEQMMHRDYDVIFLNSMRDVMIVDEYLKKHKHTKTIYTDRGNAILNIKGFHPKIPAMLYLLLRMKKWLSCYVAITAMQEQAGEKFFTKNTQVEYILTAQDKIYRKLNRKRTYNGALSVGRLDERQKKVSFMINGISEVIKKHPELKNKEILRLVGAGPHEHAYKELVKSLRLEQNVFFLGALYGDKLVEAYNNAGFVVTTSEWEGLSRVFLESLACGAPILINNNINPLIDYRTKRYLIQSGINGMVYEYGDMQDFVKKFYMMFTDEKLRRKLSSNGSKTSKEFSVDKTLNEYKKIVESL